MIVRRAVRLVQKTGRARLRSFRTTLAGRLTVPYLWCSWSDTSPSRWARRVTTSQGRLLSEPLRSKQTHSMSKPTRYAGAIRTWCSTPILNHSAPPDSRTTTRTRTRRPISMPHYRPKARQPCDAANQRPDTHNRLANHIRKIRSLAPTRLSVLLIF